MDVRIRDRFLRKGAVSPKELEAHDAALPDLEAEAEWVDYAQKFAGGDEEGEEAGVAAEAAQEIVAPPVDSPIPAIAEGFAPIVDPESPGQ